MAITATLTVSHLGQPITTGRVTLVAGTVTDVGVLANHSANARITLGRFTPGGTLGYLNYAVAGNDLTIASSNALDTSIVDYHIVG